MVRADRMWIYNRLNSDGFLNRRFVTGVDEFVDFALSKPAFLDGLKIRCPCAKCVNRCFQLPNDCKLHLYKHGVIPFPKYYEWFCQGEPYVLSSYREEVVELPQQPINAVGVSSSSFGETSSSSNVGENPGRRITLESIQEQLDGVNSKMIGFMERLEQVEARQQQQRITDDANAVRDLRERLTNVELQLGPSLRQIQRTLNQLQTDVGRIGG